MKIWCFVIKNSKTNFPVSVAHDELTAIQMVNKLNEGENLFNYTEVPMYFEKGTKVDIIAPPLNLGEAFKPININFEEIFKK